MYSEASYWEEYDIINANRDKTPEEVDAILTATEMSRSGEASAEEEDPVRGLEPNALAFMIDSHFMFLF